MFADRVGGDMAVKPNAKICRIKEQIVEDPMTGLTLRFEYREPHPKIEGGKESVKLTIYGDILPFGNRDLIFNADGVQSAAGTAVRGKCSPSWLREVPKE